MKTSKYKSCNGNDYTVGIRVPSKWKTRLERLLILLDEGDNPTVELDNLIEQYRSH